MGLIADSLRDLISAFDNEQGMPEKAYYAAKEIIWHLLGEDAAKVFVNNIDATDDCYYTNMRGDDLADKVFDAKDF